MLDWALGRSERPAHEHGAAQHVAVCQKLLWGATEQTHASWCAQTLARVLHLWAMHQVLHPEHMVTPMHPLPHGQVPHHLMARHALTGDPEPPKRDSTCVGLAAWWLPLAMHLCHGSLTQRLRFELRPALPALATISGALRRRSLSFGRPSSGSRSSTTDHLVTPRRYRPCTHAGQPSDACMAGVLHAPAAWTRAEHTEQSSILQHVLCLGLCCHALGCTTTSRILSANLIAHRLLRQLSQSVGLVLSLVVRGWLQGRDSMLQVSHYQSPLPQ